MLSDSQCVHGIPPRCWWFHSNVHCTGRFVDPFQSVFSPTHQTMLPLTLLNAAQNKPMLVELKNGETFNGHLVSCDNFMNIILREVFQTSADGERFWKMKECYVRGNTIKYLRLADAVLDQVQSDQARLREQQARSGPGSERGGRGGGRGGRGGDRGGFRGRGGGRGGGPMDRGRGRGRGA
ncbi:Small nuclear ribonucleoprotein (snRNP) [Phaffia rhodozyma]|uniref:LSM complex subunit LSM4 n=1 Tax=Phaffia rhodozyma TaxID=264483 RepID=A0A0F7SFG2_PHARH|nr:Small nuclear ribonucleoprotein (snRNP) [Phaffia rhodozyma]